MNPKSRVSTNVTNEKQSLILSKRKLTTIKEKNIQFYPISSNRRSHEREILVGRKITFFPKKISISDLFITLKYLCYIHRIMRHKKIHQSSEIQQQVAFIATNLKIIVCEEIHFPFTQYRTVVFKRKKFALTELAYEKSL